MTKKNNYHFWTYIVTNYERTVLYTGMTNNLAQRLKEHYDNRGNDKTFAGRYYCYNLIYYEYTTYVSNAILAEKEIKNLSRAKKEAMITAANLEWRFLNVDICGQWPPQYDGRLDDTTEEANDKNVTSDDDWWIGLTPPPLIIE
jgi:putative endonuclease